MNILALDIGTKKIGAALGSSFTKSPRPLAPLLDRSRHYHDLSKLITTWQIQKVILGDPGYRESNSTLLAYIEQIRSFFKEQYPNILVLSWSEEGSSQEANSVCKSSRGAGYSRDSIAATLILENYFYFSQFDPI